MAIAQQVPGGSDQTGTGNHRRTGAGMHHTDTFRLCNVFLSRPILSFSFDDFHRSALVVGGAVLESFGVRATYYASLCFLGRQTPLGAGFTLADLEQLLASGHELGCHTFDHLDARTSSPEGYESSIMRNRETIGRLFPGFTMKTFSYPFGAFTPEAGAVAGRHSLCSRGNFRGLNSGIISLNMLRANRLFSQRFPLKSVKNLITENREKSGWLIFYSHDVSSNPSPYGCHPRYLEEVVQFAVNSGTVILAIHEAFSEVMRRFRPR